MTDAEILREVITGHPSPVVVKSDKAAAKLEALGLIKRKPMTHNKYSATVKLQAFVLSTVSNALVELIEGGQANG